MSNQEFNLVDVVRLEIQEDWPDLPNQILNPGGAGLGAWGWQVRAEGTGPIVAGTISESTELADDNFGYLEFAVTSPLPATYAAAAVWPIDIAPILTSGQKFRASVNIVSLPDVADRGQFGVRLITPDDVNDYAFPALTTGVNELAATDLPIGTTEIEFFYVTPVGADGGTIRFLDATLVYGDSADVAASDPVSEPGWVNILASAGELTIERDELNLGQLAVVLYDADLDPATNDLIRPGKRYRIQTFFPAEIVGDIAIPARWRTISSGKLENPSSVYEVKDPFLDDVKRVQVRLAGTDVVGDLANTPKPRGVATFAELPYVMLGTGVPFKVNGSASVGVDLDDVPVAGYNDSASALDQIVITRDSVLGYAWVDREGTLQAWDRDAISDTVKLDIDETKYMDIVPDFDVDRTFNTLTVELVLPDGTSTTYGPYVDGANRRAWRDRQATFRVQGIEPEDIEAYAYQVLALNATPGKRVKTVTLPVRTLAERKAYALLDLYDLVTVSSDRADIADQLSRIVSIKHHMTVQKVGKELVNRWSIELGLAPDATVPPPQVTASPVVSFAKIRSMLSGAGAVKPTQFGGLGDGETNDSTALQDTFEAVADILGVKGRVEIDRPYLWDIDLLYYGGFMLFQSTPRRLPAAGVIDYLEPGLIAAGADARFRFGQTGDGSGSMNDNPGPVYNLCVDGAGIAGAEGLFYCDAAQSSLYDLMVVGCVADGVQLRIGRSQNLAFYNPQIGPSDGIGVQFKAVAGQQGAGHVTFYQGHIHDNKVGVQLDGTYGDFFPPHDNIFNSTLIESGRVEDQPIRIAIEALAGLGTQFNDVNVTFGAQVDPVDNPVEDDCSVLINNPAFPGYSTVVKFRGGTIGGGINKVTDAIRIKQDLVGAANKLTLDDVGFANVDNILCIDGDHGSDPDFADPIVNIRSFYTITGVGAFSRVINNGTQLNHGNEQPVGTRYELPDGLTNGQIQNPTVIKHESEDYARFNQDWNGQMRWLDPSTGATIGTLARNGNLWGTGGQFVIGASLGFTPASTTLAASGAVTIDSSATARHEIGFSSGGVNATSVAISNGVTGRRLVLSILGSGGANTITWPASSVIQFRTTAPQPISGVRQYVELEYVGTKWFEVSRSG